MAMLRGIILLENSPRATSISPVVIEGLTDAAENIILGHLEEYAYQQSSSAVVHATFAAAHLFMYCAFRDVPKGAKIFQILVFRLQQSLQNTNEWPLDEKHRSPSLWILFVGYAASLRIDAHRNLYKNWFSSRLNTALDERRQNGELDKEQFKKHMSEFLWVDRLCHAALAYL